MTTLDRRDFLSGAFAAFGGFLLPGCSGFAVPSGTTDAFGTPNLIFGVVSDSHFRRAHASERPGSAFPTIYFRKALEYFRDQGADAVMHCGDMAHRGLVCEMRYYADIWRKVFPNDKGLGGKPVTRLFVTGNHDWTLWGFAKEKYPNEKVRETKILAGKHMAQRWQEIWGEPYERGWHKCVKGYHFFGEHWEDTYCKLQGMILNKAKEYGLRGKKPFFIVQHRILRSGLNKALRRFPNAVAFFGHWHPSNASAMSIKFGSVPIINCGSLRGSGPLPPPGFKPVSCSNDGNVRHGLLVKVYDDMVVISRRDFFNDGPLGPDWVMPLGEYNPHPLSHKKLAQTIGAPEFASDAKLELASGEKELVIRIPAARASEKARAYAYDIDVFGDGGAKFNMCVYAAGCNLAVNTKQALGPTTVKVAAGDVPAGAKLKVTVKPISSLGVCGKPIEAEVASTVRRTEPKAAV